MNPIILIASSSLKKHQKHFDIEWVFFILDVIEIICRSFTSPDIQIYVK